MFREATCCWQFLESPSVQAWSPKKRTKGRNVLLFKPLAWQLLGVLKHLSLFTAEETGFLLRCWLGLGSAAEWEKSWAPFESHLSSGIWHVPLRVLILSRVGAVTETVLQIAGLPQGFALQELCCCRACPKYAELPERCR